MNAYDYAITIQRIEPYHYRAKVEEFPNVVEYGEHWIIAYEFMIDAIETTAEAIGWDNMPQPVYPVYPVYKDEQI